MTKEWKAAITDKRKAVKKFAQERTQENWDLKDIIAIRNYWAAKTTQMPNNPGDIYGTFKPFLDGRTTCST